MDDAIITNAQAAAENPASGPPMSYNETKAAEAKVAEAARVAALSPTDRRIEEIRKDPRFFNVNAPGREELMREYRAVVFAAGAAAQPEVYTDASPAEVRGRFDIDDPRARFGDRWTEEADAHEGDALLFMAKEGLSARTIRDIHEHAMSMIYAAAGERVPDDVMIEFVRTFKDRVPDPVLAKLVRWARDEAHL